MDQPALQQPDDDDESGLQHLSAQERAARRWGMEPEGDNQDAGGDSATRPELRLIKGGKEDGEPSQEPGKHKKEPATGSKSGDASGGWSLGSDITSAVSAAKAAGGGPTGAMKAISKTLWSTKGRRQATVGSGIGGGMIITFFVLAALLLPALKVESVINNLEKRAGAASSAAMDQEANNLLKNYLAKYVMPNLGTPRCRSTIDENCVSVVAGDGPIKQLYKAWRQDKLTEKLASKYNLTFGKSGTTVYINTNGQKFNFKDEAAMEAALTDEGTTVGTRAEAARAVSAHLKEFSKSDRMYFRFVLAPWVNSTYGTIHCVDACNAIKEKFTDPIKTREFAAKGKIYSRVVSPLSESYSFMLQCSLLGGAGCNVRDLRAAGPGSTTLQTDADAEIQGRLRTLAQGYNDEQLADLVKKSEELGKDSMSKVIVRAVVEKLASVGGGDAAKAGTAAADAVDPVTWALIAAQLADTARNIGPTLQYLGYAANSAAAAQLFTTYQSVSAETRDGNVDATELGSFNNALSTTVDTSDTSSIASANEQLKGTGTTACDMTQSPYYQQTFGSAAEAASIGTTKGNNTGCKCDDGKPVPVGKATCSEESLARGTTTTKYVAQLSGFYNAYLNAVPGLSNILSVLNKINGVASWAVEKILPLLTGPVKAYCNTPVIGKPCKAGLDAAQAAAQPLLDLTMKLIVNSPFLHLTGGRLLDMLAAGSYVVFGTSGQQTLGAPYVDNATAGKLQTVYLNQQKQDFQQQPLFARMFSTKSPYSLVSRLAVAAPSSTSAIGTQLATSFTSNPLSMLGHSFASLMKPLQASADNSAAPGANPFDVPNSSYAKAQIPGDPDTFWDNNCVNGPLGKWDASQPAGHQLDISDWLNAGHNSQNDKYLEQFEFGTGVSQPSTAKVIELARGMGMNVIQDPDTGQAIYVNPNPCLLILSTVQADGGLSDPTLLPQDALNQDTTVTDSGVGGEYTVGEYNILRETDKGHTTEICHNLGMQPGDACTKARTALQAKIIQGQTNVGNSKFDILMTDETFGNQFSLLKGDLENYGGEHSSEFGVFWNKDVFNEVDHGTSTQFSGSGRYLPAPWVKLQDTSTGQVVFVMPLHYSSYPQFNGSPAHTQEAAQKTVDWVKSKAGGDSIVIVGGDIGDFGASASRVFNAGPLQNTALMSQGKQSTGTNKGLGADQIYITPVNNLTASGWTRPAENPGTVIVQASDHAPVFVTINIPGAGNSQNSTTSGGLAWPVAKKWWDSNKALFLKPHNGGGTFTSPNVDNIADDISLPKGTPVYALASGTVIKKPLGRSSHICTGVPDVNNNGGLEVQSKIQGGTLLVAYAHGDNVVSGNTVSVGDHIMDVARVGNSCGYHLHIDMSFNGKNICPQDVFLAMGNGQTPDFAALAAKAAPACGR